MKEITDEKINKYISVTEKALGIVKIAPPTKSHLYKVAEDFLDMATRYFNDAKHFREKEDYINAFAAINYAHGWLDSGARIGLFDVNHNSELFTVD